MDNNNEYTYTQDFSREEAPAAEAETRSFAANGARDNAEPERAVPGSAKFFSLLARAALWTVGGAVGVTLLFACVLVWIGGLRYLGVIDGSTKQPTGNTYNLYITDPEGGQSGSGDQYGDFEDFFGDFFGTPGSGDFSDYFGMFGNPDGSTTPNNSVTPGIGIKAVALELDFTIDDKYTAGLVIDTIEDYSPLNGTEVQVNDMIVAANGTPTPTVDALKTQFTAVGDDVTLTIARYNGGVPTTFEVTVKLVAMQ